MLRVLLGVNLVFLLGAGAASASLQGWAHQALLLALLVEPVLIAALVLGCGVRRLTAAWPASIQMLLALALPPLLLAGWQALLAPLLNLSDFHAVRNLLVAACVTGGVLYWTRLRQRVGSRALAEARLQALQARIRPHFFFNSLNAVLGVIRNDPRRAERLLEDLAELFRVLMREPAERVALAEELTLCRRYLDIESLRLGDRLRVRWEVDAAATDARVPVLVLQPLIENAVYHGIETRVDGGEILVRIVREGRFIEMCVTNPLPPSGEPAVGRASPRRPGNHMALDNVRRRLALIHDLEARLVTRVEGGRFEVRVVLPRDGR